MDERSRWPENWKTTTLRVLKMNLTARCGHHCIRIDAIAAAAADADSAMSVINGADEDKTRCRCRCLPAWCTCVSSQMLAVHSVSRSPPLALRSFVELSFRWKRKATACRKRIYVAFSSLITVKRIFCSVESSASSPPSPRCRCAKRTVCTDCLLLLLGKPTLQVDPTGQRDPKYAYGHHGVPQNTEN